MKNYQSIVYIVLAMFAFGLMALFTREANADILTIATWRAILVAILFGIGAAYQKELRFFTKKNEDKSNQTSNVENIEINSLEKTKHQYMDLSSEGLLSKSHLQSQFHMDFFWEWLRRLLSVDTHYPPSQTPFFHNLAVLFTIHCILEYQKEPHQISFGRLISLVGVGFISEFLLFHALILPILGF